MCAKKCVDRERETRRGEDRLKIGVVVSRNMKEKKALWTYLCIDASPFRVTGLNSLLELGFSLLFARLAFLGAPHHLLACQPQVDQVVWVGRQARREGKGGEVGLSSITS